jgi:hypothetical protein
MCDGAPPSKRIEAGSREPHHKEETDMKRLAALALVGTLMVPGVAAAGSSTDAALGLGAFAVFNQIISGTGVFGGGRTVIIEQPVVVAPPPVVYAPAPPPVVYAPPPPPVVYAPPGTVVYQAPPVLYSPAPVYGYYAPYPRHRPWHRHWD